MVKTIKKLSYAADDRYSLYKRYLFWLYKMTRDELDRIERKFTQLEIDEEITRFFDRVLTGLSGALSQEVGGLVDEWKRYVAQKAADASRLKHGRTGAPKPEILLLHMKLAAVEKLADSYLGKKALKDFRRLYEDAAMQRILEDTSGRR